MPMLSAKLRELLLFSMVRVDCVPPGLAICLKEPCEILSICFAICCVREVSLLLLLLRVVLLLLLVLPAVFLRILRGVSSSGLQCAPLPAAAGLPGIGAKSGLFQFGCQRRQVCAHRVRKARIGSADRDAYVSGSIRQPHFYSLPAADVQLQLDIVRDSRRGRRTGR